MGEQLVYLVGQGDFKEPDFDFFDLLGEPASYTGRGKDTLQDRLRPDEATLVQHFLTRQWLSPRDLDYRKNRQDELREFVGETNERLNGSKFSIATLTDVGYGLIRIRSRKLQGWIRRHSLERAAVLSQLHDREALHTAELSAFFRQYKSVFGLRSYSVRDNANIMAALAEQEFGIEVRKSPVPEGYTGLEFNIEYEGLLDKVFTPKRDRPPRKKQASPNYDHLGLDIDSAIVESLQGNQFRYLELFAAKGTVSEAELRAFHGRRQKSVDIRRKIDSFNVRLRESPYRVSAIGNGNYKLVER